MVMATLTLLLVSAFVASLVIGHTVYSLEDILRVVLGEEVPGASFTIGTLRLPRAVLAVVAGMAFAMGGVTFQTMLRNPLASPDVIGISAGASAAAVLAIVVLGLSGLAVSGVAIAAGLGVALVIYTLSWRDGVAGVRLVLIGIGIAAVLDSVIAYILGRTTGWDLQEALRWLTGSLNGATWQDATLVLVALGTLGPALLWKGRDLAAMQLGDDTAAALGVRLEPTRVVAIVAAVGLIAFATAATGPIAFVAFLAGPVAVRLVGTGGSLLIPAALVGALLVVVADLCGQWAFGTRYPVGVITGVLGAPYLVYLIIRSHRTGGSL